MAENSKELFQSLEDFANETPRSIYGGARLMGVLKQMARALVYLYKKRGAAPLEQYRTAGPCAPGEPGIPCQQVKLHGTEIPLRKRGK